MKNYKNINTILGWLMFVVASIVYVLTSEPTASFWDCGEYISTAYKLQVGHPPGAPFFQLLGRFFTLFAFGDTQLVARMINTMSALMSGATIMFLFWTITAFSRKVVCFDGEEYSPAAQWTVLGSGIVGALAYTFSDSFWFSAVEGEVYATSSFFTAVAFWAILKWEAVSEENSSWRWVILIAYLMGLSIGVHLLNLLTIPAITFVFYFKNYKPTVKGVIAAFAVAVLLLAVILNIIIPEVLSLFASTELMFVNGMGLPFNSGTIFFVFLLIVIIASSLAYTASPNRWNSIISIISSGLLILLVLLASSSIGNFFIRLLICAIIVFLIFKSRTRYGIIKTVVLCTTFLIIGYSSFLLLVIRSNAGTPINENSPKDAISLLSYLNREQYGSWPILYGQYYCAPLDPEEPYLDGNPVYGKDYKTGKYVVVDDRKATIPNYDDKFCTFFPRMWSSQQDFHISGYKSWGDVQGVPVKVKNFRGKYETIYKPTFAENLKFFFKYQLGHMYFRYFMWNFAGKQNDIQGYGGILDGNWMSGINFIDKIFNVSQSNLPDHMANNKGRNAFYFLPLLLGLFGLFYQMNKNYKGLIIVGLLFLFTGIAINIYLNPVPYQPRERDYAYAASFYAFAIWIGIGVLFVYNLLKKKLNVKWAAVISVLISLFLVPGIMAKEGWDDHDRSGRTTAVDIASNYLNTCAPNAILFTLGDNDTFPLWYAQEVEGVRTDVRVVNLSLLSTDWYIDQMKRRIYNSAPLPLSIEHDKYIGSKREITFIYEDTTLIPPNAFVDLKKLIEFALSDDERAKLKTLRGDFNYFPTPNFSVPVDGQLVIKNSTVPQNMKDSVLSDLYWVYPDYGVTKSSLVVLDILAHFNWERPVYFAITTGEGSYIGLQPYFQLEGLAYRLVPFKCESIDGMVGRVNTNIMYDNMMNKFKWGNIHNPDIYIDETNLRMVVNVRNTFSRLAYALSYENKMDSAIKVCDRCVEVVPNECVPYDKMLLPLIEIYYHAGEFEKGNAVADKILDRYIQELNYYSQFNGVTAASLGPDINEALSVLKGIAELSQKYEQKEIFDKAYEALKDYV